MSMGGLLWIIVVGFIAGLIARWLAPGPNNPSGFILTTILGIVGAFLATFVGQAIGHYSPDQGAGFIMATIGAVVGAVHLAPTGREWRDQGVARRRFAAWPAKKFGVVPAKALGHAHIWCDGLTRVEGEGFQNRESV
ncbi:putative membrane protein YeaQ/YmgE (transglycosylase-associated protein family) [Bradyrhizobium sp. LM4.3]